MLLKGKRIVVTGVLTDDSIAWHAARIAIEEETTAQVSPAFAHVVVGACRRRRRR